MAPAAPGRRRPRGGRASRSARETRERAANADALRRDVGHREPRSPPFPGEPIGKSGTAEFGTADPPKTHAWFIAARDDVAVAVLVEEGTSGGEVAAPIAASFLTALPIEP